MQFLLILVITMKKANIVLLTIVMLIFSACRHERVPDNVIDTATLRAFLVEAHLIEGYQERTNRDNRDTINANIAAAYSTLYDKYGITAADYDSSIVYYMRTPRILEEVYARVVSDLKGLRDEISGDEGAEGYEELIEGDTLNTDPVVREIIRKRI